MKEIVLIALLGWTFVNGITIMSQGVALWAKLVVLVVSSIFVVFVPLAVGAALEIRKDDDPQ